MTNKVKPGSVPPKKGEAFVSPVIKDWAAKLGLVAGMGVIAGIPEERLFDLLVRATNKLDDERWGRGFEGIPEMLMEQMAENGAIARAAIAEMEKRPGGVEGVIARVLEAEDELAMGMGWRR